MNVGNFAKPFVSQPLLSEREIQTDLARTRAVGLASGRRGATQTATATKYQIMNVLIHFVHGSVLISSDWISTIMESGEYCT